MFAGSEETKHECLVVDTNAIIRGVHVERMAKELYTVPEVLKEIRDKQTRQGVLATLVVPEIKVRDPTPEALDQVTAMAKETGDYPFLSEPDLRAIALTLTIFNERNPDCVVALEEPTPEPAKKEEEEPKPEEKKEEPEPKEEPKAEETKTKEEEKKKEPPKSAWGSGLNWAAVLAPPTPEQMQAMKKGASSVQTAHEITEAQKKKKAEQQRAKLELEKRKEIQKRREERYEALEAEAEEEEPEPVNEDDAMAAAAAAAWGDGDDDDDDGDENEGDEDSEGEWITPENLKEMQEKMGGNDLCVAETVGVGCITGDFAMQNVLMHLALDVVGVEGLRIRAARTWMMKCFSCFSFTRDTNKVFCPTCGNSTLSRVAVESKSDGTFEEVSLVTKAQQISNRHVRVALPPPRGGRKNRDAITCEEELQRRLRTMPKPKKDDVAGLAYDGRFNGRLTLQQQRKLVYSGGIVQHKKRTGKKKRSNK